MRLLSQNHQLFQTGPSFNDWNLFTHASRPRNPGLTDLFLAFSPALYINMSFAPFAQLAHCVVILYRLSTFEYLGWDLTLVCETLSFSLVIDKVVTTMARVIAAAGLDPESLVEIWTCSLAYHV